MSNFPKYQFRELKMNTPWDNLTAAISIIQSYILASDTALDPQAMWGGSHIHGDSLEAAVALLSPISEVVDQTEWEAPRAPAA